MATSLLTQIQCARHPERAAFALCMKCRQPCCAECSTEWDGVNLCFTCLQREARTSTKRSAVSAFLLTSVAAAVFVYTLSRAMAWSIAIVASWGS